MSHEDYRQPLAIDALAIALYNSVTVFHHLQNEGWTALTEDERARYRQLAKQQLMALTPPDYRGNIGSRDLDAFSAKLFQFGATLARDAAKGER